MTRDEAERFYADLVITKGNPRFFIFRYLNNIDNDYLAELIEILDEKPVEIEDEE